MSYPWQTLNPKDNIIIEFSGRITALDMNILSMLYKPIVKEKSFSLYATLKNYYEWGRFERADILLSRLLAEVDLGIKDYYESRIKLEALGLLNVYKNDDNQFIYVVNPPLSAKEFFSEPILCVLLEDLIGENLFSEYKSQLLPTLIDKSQYKNITKSFFDVFQVDSSKITDIDVTNNQRGHNRLVNQYDLQNGEFDWTLFKQSISRQLVKSDFLTSKIEELIYVYHVTYGIDELEMRDAVLEAADLETGEVPADVLKKILNRYVSRLGKVNQLSTESAVNESNIGASSNDVTFTDDKAKKVLEVAKSISPYDYLDSIKKQKNGFVSSNEKYLLKELIEYAKLPSEVINILIHYVLVIKKNSNLGKTFTLKIADDWAQKHVRTAEDAIRVIKNLYQKKSESSQKSTKKYYSSYKNAKTESKPDWMENPSEDTGEMEPSKEREMRQRLQNILMNEGES